MSAGTRRRLASRRTFRIVAVVILAVVLFVSWRAIPRVPRRILILSGPSGGAYHEYGERYAEYLREKGLAAAVVETKGSLENLKRLASEDRAAVGFAQAGVEAELEDRPDLEELVSLGSLSFEPVWLFHRDGEHLEDIRALDGRRLGLGPRGSGSWAIADLLLTENGLADRVETVRLDPATVDAAQALTSGDIDAICLVGDLRSKVVSRLLADSGVTPASLPRTAAYARRRRELAKLTLPRGTIDLALDIPATDLKLIATTTNLVAREGLHPAAVGLLLEAAREIHRPASLFADEGTFPTTAYTSLPVGSAAVTYLQQGQGVAYRLLPFWLAGLLTWLFKLLTPLATVALFLYRVIPSLLHLRFEERVRSSFKRLERLEKARGAGVDREKLGRDLDQLDRDSVNLGVPRSMASMYVELRQAVHDMRERLNRG